MSQETPHQNQPLGEVSLARKVSRMGMLIHRYYDAKAHRHGAMGDPLRGQGRVLTLLKAKPQTTQRELSYLLDMRQQSLSELLTKLEEKGYIIRSKSADDGRVTEVHLTEAGAAAAPSPQQMEERADALDCLSADEQAQLEALTNKVTASIEEKLSQMGIDPHRGPRGGHGPHAPHRHHGPHPPFDGKDFMQRGPYRPHDEGNPHAIRQA